MAHRIGLMEGLLFGIGAAIGFGLADIAATVSSRAAGVLRPLLVMQAGGALLLTPLLFVVPLTGHLEAAQILSFVGVGVMAMVAFLAFFRGLQEGPVAIVTPVVSAYAVIVVILAIVLLDERPSALQYGGIGLTFLGVVLASADLRELSNIRISRGVGFAFVALAGFGYELYFVARETPELSWFLPTYLLRVCAAIPLLAICAARRTWPWQVRSFRLLGLMALVAVFDAAGFTSYGLGVDRGFASVVATATSAYSVIPILFGLLVLRERLAPNQFAGIALVLAGLLALGVSA